MIDETAAPGGGVTRRRFLQGSAIAGFGAFLAACTGGATKRQALRRDRARFGRDPDAAARPRPGRPSLRHPRPYRPAPLGAVAGLHRPCRQGRRRGQVRAGLLADARGVQEEVLGRRQLRREDRGQRGLLRRHPAAARRRRADRLGHDHDHGLARGQDHQQGLGREDRPDQRPELRREPARCAQEPGLGHGPGLPLPVAVRDDRHRLQQGQPRRTTSPSRSRSPTCGRCLRPRSRSSTRSATRSVSVS